MKIIIGADSNGMELKKAITDDLRKRNYEVVDINPVEPMLFQDVAVSISRGVQSKEFDRGIGLCGTGMGVSIICNKHRGVYAALCESVYQARRAKTVNNTNVLCMGGFIVGNEMGIEMAKAWLEAAHLSGLETEMKKMVEKEYEKLVEFEEVYYSSQK